MKKSNTSSTVKREKAILVQGIFSGQKKEWSAASLAELENLADTAGAEVVGIVTQRRDRPTPSFFVGEGKLADIQLACRQANAGLIIFDNELSAVQVNNLDQSLGIKVIDRTELILQIFARRARSAESKIQVELAQLQYLISRIPVSMKQARFSGGIGMRGPGESPLQLRNEPMKRRIKDLKVELEKIQAHRKRTMSKKAWPLVCLVGYTNVGKSTLLNAFAAAQAYVDDRLFATLDTKTRFVHIPGCSGVLMTDTVGFIRNLPHGLVASFRSTLEVARDADLLLVVADASHANFEDQLTVVRDTLLEIGAEKVPWLMIFNKCDTEAANAALPELLKKYPSTIAVSATEKQGLDKVKEAIKNVVYGSNADR